MPDDLGGHELLTAALAAQRVWSLLRSPHDTELTVDMLIELSGVDGLDALLGKLHMISPQVFVSNADQSAPLATAQ
jgi:hypothetical protein